MSQKENELIVTKSKTDVDSVLSRFRKMQKKIAFVPTMGCLHNGHLNLIEIAKRVADVVIVSIFVNQKQFGANEDFSSYPRNLAQDIEKLEKTSATVLFAPQDDLHIFGRNGFNLEISAPLLQNVLCGASRPKFLPGVMAVLYKMLDIIKPHYIIMGEKDYQQYLVVKEMIQSFEIQTDTIMAETYREKNGLAMSSRNQYLTKQELEIAPKIFENMTKIKNYLLQNNNKNISDVLNFIETQKTDLLNCGFSKIDYFELRCNKTLSNITNENLSKSRIFFAGFLGKARLIDNLSIE